MTDFWEIVESSIRKSEGNRHLQRDIMVKILSELGETDVYEFHVNYQRAMIDLYNHDTIAAFWLLNDEYCSEDSIYDFCDCMVSSGKQIFEMTLADPESLLDIGVRPFWNSDDSFEGETDADADGFDYDSDCWPYDEFDFCGSAVDAIKIIKQLPTEEDFEIEMLEWPGEPSGKPVANPKDRFPRLCELVGYEDQ